MFKSGEFVAEYVKQEDGSRVPDTQIQPHGVELTVDKIFKLRGPCILRDDDYKKATREEAELVEHGEFVETTDLADHRRARIRKKDESAEPSSSVSKNDRSEFEVQVPHYTLITGPYVVRYNEKISIPDNAVGFVLPRSRLIRNNNYLTTAVWDSGYKGRGEGGLHINTLTFLEKGMRIGQILMANARVMEQYDGSRQRENIE